MWGNGTKESGDQAGASCSRQSVKCVLLHWEQKQLGSEGDTTSLNSSLDLVFFRKTVNVKKKKLQPTKPSTQKRKNILDFFSVSEC